MCPVHLDREKTTNLSQATNKLNNRATRCVQYTWTGRKPPICHKPLINLIQHKMCPVHLDREKTTNLSQATNKLNNRATRCPVDREKTTNLSQATNKLNNRARRCVQYTWTGRNHQSVTRCVQYTWTGRKPPICHKPLINLITEQQDVSSTPGPGATNKLNNRARRCVQYTWTGKTTNLSQATNKLNNRATRCVQYTWTGRKPPICHSH